MAKVLNPTGELDRHAVGSSAFAGDPAARNFFVAAGVGLLVVAALTDYRSSGARSYSGDERRSHLIERRQRALAVAVDRRIGGFDRRDYA